MPVDLVRRQRQGMSALSYRDVDMVRLMSGHQINRGMRYWILALPAFNSAIRARNIGRPDRHDGNFTGITDPLWGFSAGAGGLGEWNFNGTTTQVYQIQAAQTAFTPDPTLGGTWSVWVRITTNGVTCGIISKWQYSSIIEWVIERQSDGDLHFELRDSANRQFYKYTPYPTDLDWHHIIATWDGGTSSDDSIKLYLDGKEGGTVFRNASFDGVPTKAVDFRIGSKNGAAGSWLPGKIRSVRFQQAALSPDEAYLLYLDETSGHPLTLNRKRRTVPVWTHAPNDVVTF